MVQKIEKVYDKKRPNEFRIDIQTKDYRKIVILPESYIAMEDIYRAFTSMHMHYQFCYKYKYKLRPSTSLAQDMRLLSFTQIGMQSVYSPPLV